MKVGSAIVAVVLAWTAVSPSAVAQEKVRVLIIDGRNNHDWSHTTPFLKTQLEKTGRFTVSISTSPPKGAPAADFAAWKPDFSQCDVVLSNYNGPPWPERVRVAFERFMRDGGGLVNVHAANNAHRGWAEFEKMTGMLWRPAKYGPRLVFDDAGELITIPKGEGKGAGHGPQHEYLVETRAPEHPIMRGLPGKWLHPKDELYHGQRGPAKDMHILATAYSDKKYRGTGYHEPVLWWIPYGKGRAVTNVLGHVGRKSPDKLDAMACVGNLTFVERSCEWAATGQVTLPVPANFPTTEKTSVVDY